MIPGIRYAVIMDSDVTILSDGHRYTYTDVYISDSYSNSGFVYCDNAKYYDHQPEQLKRNSSSTESKQGSSDSGVRHTNAEAFTVAQMIVEDYLKSPSTAKFCKVTEATITNSGDKYTVSGWVDAQNSFGETVRQSFTVTYTAVKKGNDIGFKNGEATFAD